MKSKNYDCAHWWENKEFYLGFALNETIRIIFL